MFLARTKNLYVAILPHEIVQLCVIHFVPHFQCIPAMVSAVRGFYHGSDGYHLHCETTHGPMGVRGPSLCRGRGKQRMIPAREHTMKLSDERVIEFLWKSPLKSFPAMLDALRYLDGASITAEVEYELFDEPLGDNAEKNITIRVPDIRGIRANALLAFTGHAQNFNIVRRRPRTILLPGSEPELRVFYELTPSGGYVVKILEVLTDVSSHSEQSL
jgi:hypothetical protein